MPVLGMYQDWFWNLPLFALVLHMQIVQVVSLPGAAAFIQAIVCSHDRCLIDSGGHKRQKRDERNAGQWIICQRLADSVHAQQNSHWWTAGRAERAPTACARFFMPFYHFLILISLARVV